MTELVINVPGLPSPDELDDVVLDPDNDIDRALGMLLALSGDPDDFHYTVLEWEPASKARPRFGKGGRTYTPAESRKAEARTAAWLRRFYPEPMPGNVALAAIFFRPNRQRIDVDNMLKHVCDAANGILWHDDSQVTAVLGVVELDTDRPRTLLAFAPHMSTMTRGADATYPCAQCGRPIAIEGRSSKPKTCSKDCAARLRGFEPLDVPIPCAECGEPFRRTTRAQRLCSPECRSNRVRGARRATGRPKSDCMDCGKTLTHHRGGRCRDCWRASVATAAAATGARITVAALATPTDTSPADASSPVRAAGEVPAQEVLFP